MQKILVEVDFGGEFPIEMPIEEYIVLRATGKQFSKLEKALPAALVTVAARFLLPLLIRALPAIIALILPPLIRAGTNLLSQQGITSLVQGILGNIGRAIPQLSALLASPPAKGALATLLQNALSRIIPTLRGRDANEVSRELAQKLQEFLSGAGQTQAQQALTQALQSLPPQQAAEVTAAVGGAMAKAKIKIKGGWEI